MSASDPLPIRPFRDGDEAQLVALFASVFGRPLDAAHWRWKLAHATPKVPNVLLAMAGERPVFQYAGIPTAFSVGGARVDAMVSVDTMTAPDFRRRGLLTRVATDAYARWRDAGVEFVFGLPNEQWGSRAAALGWIKLFKLTRMVRPLRPEAMLAHRLSMPWLRKLSFASTLWNGLFTRGPSRDPAVRTKPVSEAGAEFDRLWERCKGDAKFSVVRDRHWVNWRFLCCPSRHYQLRLAMRGNDPVGYCAVHIVESDGRRRAYLAELCCVRSDGAARDTLLADLIDELRAQDVEFIGTLAVPGTSTYRGLSGAGFFGGPSFSVEMVPLSKRLPLDDMRRPENWELSGAAFDVI
jgi:hypothetical protein